MANNYLPTDYQNFVGISRYARWLPEENRRERWDETVARYFDFMEGHLKKQHGYVLQKSLRNELEEAVLTLQVMPSMRCLMTAGPALERENMAGFNCSYIAVDDLRAFDEACYLLMCGTGVGFSVEQKFTDRLPVVAESFSNGKGLIRVEDSKEGWCSAFRELIERLYEGKVHRVDYSAIRPAGERLKTFGGRASGPGPLKELMEFTQKTIMGAAGRKLTPLECHDIMCYIGSVVVVGGVRRSALISLSDLNDAEMREAKSGEWWNVAGHRALANNSYVVDGGKPDMATFLREWTALYNSHSGERGIFSRDAAKKQVAKYGRRDPNHEFGTNPCSEIILRPNQTCNLTELVVRATDDFYSLQKKIRLATILGTFQSTLVNYKYLRPIWKQNAEEERLLGVSMTGILDNKMLSDPYEPKLPVILATLREIAVDTNALMAREIGINPSTALTAIKPSGSVSQLVDSASGLHTRHSKYYIRTIRGDNKDPLTDFMKAQGVPNEPCVMKPNDTTIFSFPQKAPEGALTRDSLTAIQHLDLWLAYQVHYCCHKPSITITYRDEEFMDVGAWVWKNLDNVSGVSLLPHSDHTYLQAPYQECDEATYQAMLDRMPKNIDWHKLSDFEKVDSTTGTQELACVAGGCEIT